MFSFDGVHVLLTYSQSPLLSQQILDHLQSIKPLEWARVCQEQHQDGQPHQHVVAKFADRFQSRNARVFDIAGIHPNVQPVRSVARALAYIAKDGQFVDFGAVPEHGRQAADRDQDWVALARTSTAGEYFMAALRAGVPFGYADRFWEIGSRVSSEIGDDYESNLEWECETLHELLPQDGKTVVIIGPPGIGKSCWAKRICKKPCLWVRHLDVLRSFRPGYHNSIIFDDMEFKHLPRQAQIHLVDQTDEAHVHTRYKHAVIPAHTMKVFTSNEMPFETHGAIERRIQLINLYI